MALSECTRGECGMGDGVGGDGVLSTLGTTQQPHSLRVQTHGALSASRRAASRFWNCTFARSPKICMQPVDMMPLPKPWSATLRRGGGGENGPTLGWGDWLRLIIYSLHTLP